MRKAIIIRPTLSRPKTLSLERLLNIKNLLTVEEIAEQYPKVHAAIGGVVGGIENYPPLTLHAAAPPQGKTWDDIVNAIDEGKEFSLQVVVSGEQQSTEETGRGTTVANNIVVMAGKAAFEPSSEKVQIGDKEVPKYFFGDFTPTAEYTRRERYKLPSRGGREGDILTEEELERLKELPEEGERERTRISLEELLEMERKAEEEAKEKEEEELVEQAISRIGDRKKLLKHVLLSKIAVLLEKVKAPLLEKAKKKDSDKRDDVEGAKRKLEEGLKALSEGNGLEALEDFATARFYLSDHDSYTEPLVNAFDDLAEIAWNAYKGRKYSKERAGELVRRILRLIENPRGERAEPPRRVDSPRDARLWEMAKRIVKDEYRDVEEDSEQFWQIVSRIFTRMKLRLGGAREEVVERVVEELREKHGKLPGAGKGAKTAKEVERLKEKHLRSGED